MIRSWWGRWAPTHETVRGASDAGFNSPPRITSFLPHSRDYLILSTAQRKSPVITRALERAKGLEPSTFTLAR
jgi:hypothetical protein